MQRIRITYAKTVPLRYTGNLDVHKVWERILRRAALPLAYTQGFHPQPRLNQACPLPLGMTGCSEMIDIWFECPVMLQEIARILSSVLPDGIKIQSIHEVELNAPALQSLVIAADYLVSLLDPFSGLEEKVSEMLKAPTLLRQRRGKTYDLRPLVESLEILPAPVEGDQQLAMCLSLRSGATGRPEELLLALGIDPSTSRIERTALVFI